MQPYSDLVQIRWNNFDFTQVKMCNEGYIKFLKKKNKKKWTTFLSLTEWSWFSNQAHSSVTFNGSHYKKWTASRPRAQFLFPWQTPQTFPTNEQKIFGSESLLFVAIEEKPPNHGAVAVAAAQRREGGGIALCYSNSLFHLSISPPRSRFPIHSLPFCSVRWDLRRWCLQSTRSFLQNQVSSVHSIRLGYLQVELIWNMFYLFAICSIYCLVVGVGVDFLFFFFLLLLFEEGSIDLVISVDLYWLNWIMIMLYHYDHVFSICYAFCQL